MATTIDKYVLETSVTGMKDVDALNTSVTTLGKSIDTVTSKKIAMTINATGFDDLNTKIGNINTSLNTLATKTAKPTVSLAGIDQLNAMISGLSSSINQLGGKVLNINADSNQVIAAKREVDRLSTAIDNADKKDINVKAQVSGNEFLSNNLKSIGDSFKGISDNAIAALGAAAIAFAGFAAKSAIDANNLANAYKISADTAINFGDSITAMGGDSSTAGDMLKDLVKNVKDAADGGKEAQDAFNALNGTFTNSDGNIKQFSTNIFDANGKLKSNDTILKEVVRSLKLMNDAAIKSGDNKKILDAQAAAVKVLGDEAGKLNWEKAIIPASVNTSFTENISAIGELKNQLSGLLDDAKKATINGMGGLADKLSSSIGVFRETDDWLLKIQNTLNGMYQSANLFTFGGLDSLVGFFNRITGTKNPVDTLNQANKAAIAGARATKSKDEIAGPAELSNITAGYESQGPTPKDPAAESAAKAAADKAKADREARDRARQSMDAEMTALKAASNMKLEAIKHEGTLLGLSSRAASENRAAIEIQNNLKRDYLQIDAEILQEKQKGSKADQYIIDKLKEQKGIVNDLASSSLDQLTANNSIKQGIEDRTTALKSQYDAVLGISKLEDSDVKTAAIQKEIDKHTLLKDQYTAQYDELVKIGEQQGLLSAAYLTAAENFTAYNDVWMQTMDAQKSKIAELQAAEKTRSESFAGGWESAMQRMTKSMEPAQLGAQAFDNMWGQVSSSIDTAVTTGKFKFADFRDAIIADIAKMMAKALASKLIGTLLGTAVSAVIPGAGAGMAIGGDKGGSAIFPRAGGGSVSGNQPYLVGERGPELFMPGQNGTVIPNRNLAESKPQVVNNYTYNVSAVDANGVAKFFMDNKTMVAAANSAARRERG